MTELLEPATDIPAPNETPVVTIAEQLADFAAAFSYESLPDYVLRSAKLLILDAVGIALASSREEFGHRMLCSLRSFGGPEECSLIGFSERLALRDAVLMNSSLIHGLDYDDTHIASIVHPSASALSCALGLSERLAASGKALLAAYILGAETVIRIAHAANGNFQRAGFHPTGLAAHFSCAIQAGWLYGLTASQIAAAQGIAISTAAGTQEFLVEGAWNKRLHPGWACVGGLTAAKLAQHGFVAVRHPYEGRTGLYKGFLGALEADVDYHLVIGGIGQRWELPNVAVKPYPICHMIHACADCALALKQKHSISPLEIKRVVVQIPPEMFPVIAEPVKNKTKPRTEYEAKFSVQYVVAACLVRGRFTLTELQDSALHDPSILRVAAMISVERDFDSQFPKFFSGGVIVETDTASFRQYEPVNRGAGDRALTAEEITAKYRENASSTVPGVRATAIYDAVMNIEKSTARDFASILRLA